MLVTELTRQSFNLGLVVSHYEVHRRPAQLLPMVFVLPFEGPDPYESRSHCSVPPFPSAGFLKIRAISTPGSIDPHCGHIWYWPSAISHQPGGGRVRAVPAIVRGCAQCTESGLKGTEVLIDRCSFRFLIQS
jgi:hypothetical protein